MGHPTPAPRDFLNHRLCHGKVEPARVSEGSCCLAARYPHGHTHWHRPGAEGTLPEPLPENPPPQGPESCSSARKLGGKTPLGAALTVAPSLPGSLPHLLLLCPPTSQPRWVSQGWHLALTPGQQREVCPAGLSQAPLCPCNCSQPASSAPHDVQGTRDVCALRGRPAAEESGDEGEGGRKGWPREFVQRWFTCSSSRSRNPSEGGHGANAPGFARKEGESPGRV